MGFKRQITEDPLNIEASNIRSTSQEMENERPQHDTSYSGKQNES